MNIICLDFDGVVNDYQGWRDEGFDVILDEPKPGAVEGIKALRAMGYRVVIHSARTGYEGGIRCIKFWLEKHGIVVDDVAEHKPVALIYVDDRGMRFTDWGVNFNGIVDRAVQEKAKEDNGQ